MLGIFSISILFTIFQVVTSQIPPHCRRPPPGVIPTDCCKIPNVFTKEDLQECGIEDPAKRKGIGPEVCSKHECLLKRYNLMKDDNSVDKEAVGDFLDGWCVKNIKFKEAIASAKKTCLQRDLPGPSHICEATKIGLCVMVTTFHNCPVMEDTENCKKFKEHLDECKPYLQF